MYFNERMKRVVACQKKIEVEVGNCLRSIMIGVAQHILPFLRLIPMSKGRRRRRRRV